MKLLQPPVLGPGDRIGVAAPGGPVDRESLDAGMAYLTGRGYTVVPGDHLAARHGFLAGSDRDRLADLNRLIADPRLRAVWFARGGYGSMRLLQDLDLAPLRAHPKALIGYSDVTSLQAAVFRRLRLVSFYGPMVVELGQAERFDEPALWEAIAGGSSAVEHPLPAATVLRAGRGEGPLVGGCLSMLVALVGTPYEVRTDGAILFWEEVNEEPFRIDRMLGHLRLANKLAGLRGMVVGRLVGCVAREKENDLPIEEILATHLRGTDYPVILDLPTGHAPRKITLPLGCVAHLDTGERTLSFPGD